MALPFSEFAGKFVVIHTDHYHFTEGQPFIYAFMEEKATSFRTGDHGNLEKCHVATKIVAADEMPTIIAFIPSTLEGITLTNFCYYWRMILRGSILLPAHGFIWRKSVVC